MLSKWAVTRARGDRKDQSVVHAVTISYGKTSWCHKKQNVIYTCWHHQLWQVLVVTEKARKRCILSPSAAVGPHSDRNDHKVVHAGAHGDSMHHFLVFSTTRSCH